ncbi:MAG: hypothetical protein Q9216_005349 [Gyalolechia sp. 2 TL-2023]
MVKHKRQVMGSSKPEKHSRGSPQYANFDPKPPLSSPQESQKSGTTPSDLSGAISRMNLGPTGRSSSQNDGSISLQLPPLQTHPTDSGSKLPPPRDFVKTEPVGDPMLGYHRDLNKYHYSSSHRSPPPVNSTGSESTPPSTTSTTRDSDPSSSPYDSSTRHQPPNPSTHSGYQGAEFAPINRSSIASGVQVSPEDDWLVQMIHVGIHPAGMASDFLSKAFSSEASKFNHYYPLLKYGTVYLSNGSSVRATWADRMKKQNPLDEMMYHELIKDILDGLNFPLSDRIPKKKSERGKKSFEFDEDQIRKSAKETPGKMDSVEKGLISGTLRPHDIYQIFDPKAIDRVYDGFRKPNRPDSFDISRIQGDPHSHGDRLALMARARDGWPGYEYPVGALAFKFPNLSRFTVDSNTDSNQRSTSRTPNCRTCDILKRGPSIRVQPPEKYNTDSISKGSVSRAGLNDDDEPLTDLETKAYELDAKRKRAIKDPVRGKIDEPNRVSKRKPKSKR